MKAQSNYSTLSLDAVFSDNVFFDPQDQVVYDMDRHLAIGYYTEARTCLIINFLFPVIVDERYEKEYEDLSRYFDLKNVTVVNGKYVYYRTTSGYSIHLGTYTPDTGTDAACLTIKLPRVPTVELDPSIADDIDDWCDLNLFN